MEKTIGFRNTDEQRLLFGPRDKYLRQVRDHCQVRVVSRNGELKLEGDTDNVQNAWVALLQMLEHIRRGGTLDDQTVEQVLSGQRVGVAAGGSARDQMERSQRGGGAGGRGDRDRDRGDRGDRGRKSRSRAGGVLDIGYGNPEAEREIRITAKPMSAGQGDYMHAIREHDLVFCTGPAGCGKTFLATAMAVEALNSGRVRKIVLVRPAVEAGEKLGFLPGDFQAKINPYLRPIFDALGALLDYGALRRYMERDVIEIAPLAYMRGRTLENAFIILDEAQNTTPSQMKMFLTRFGRKSKVVVTGDMTQVDLPLNQISGLKHARRVLGDVPGIAWCELGEKDIVRHGLVQRIVNAYEVSEQDADAPLFSRLRDPRDRTVSGRRNGVRSSRREPVVPANDSDGDSGSSTDSGGDPVDGDGMNPDNV